MLFHFWVQIDLTSQLLTLFVSFFVIVTKEVATIAKEVATVIKEVDTITKEVATITKLYWAKVYFSKV